MLSSFLKFSKLVILEGKVWIYPRNISLENLYVPVASVWYLYKNHPYYQCVVLEYCYVTVHHAACQTSSSLLKFLCRLDLYADVHIC